MFGEPRLERISLEILNKDKKHKFDEDIVISQSGEIAYSELISLIKHRLVLKEDPSLFYYDHEQQIYVLLQGQNQSTVHYSLISTQGLIQLRVQQKISDEVMANQKLKPEESRQKRSPQRDIADAFELVLQWRQFYLKGTINIEGNWQKVNLEKGAAILNTPRKTLQDYYLLFRQGLNLGFKFFQNRRRKIGLLRAYIKEHKKTDKQKDRRMGSRDEQIFLKRLRKMIFPPAEQFMQQELFNVINCSSDEDSIKMEQQLYEEQYEN